MKKIPSLLALIFFTTTILLIAIIFTNKEQPTSVIGSVEHVYIKNADINLTGRVDTGAGVSSINAEIIKINKPTTKDGAESVVFRIKDQNKQTLDIEAEIIEWQNIKKKGHAGYMKRPVVEMVLCIGKKRVRARVNLADREGFLYPLLIGRNTLKAGDFLIDPAKKFTSEPLCKKK